jgi:hypothetical protein
MKIKLAKGKYKTLGKISNRSISADKTRLDVTIGGIQLLEQVSE